jgi:hypothetical protein
MKNILDHICESLETIFWVKVLKFIDADADLDLGSGNLFDSESGIRDGKNSDPQVTVRNTGFERSGTL